jgi:hypothetical protein
LSTYFPLPGPAAGAVDGRLGAESLV